MCYVDPLKRQPGMMREKLQKLARSMPVLLGPNLKFEKWLIFANLISRTPITNVFFKGSFMQIRRCTDPKKFEEGENGGNNCVMIKQYFAAMTNEQKFIDTVKCGNLHLEFHHIQR